MLNRVPDNTIIAGGQGDKAEHMEAFRSSDRSCAMIYLPVGKTITLHTANLPAQITAWWFNPKDAGSQMIELAGKKDNMEFSPPTMGPGNDWVLVLDDSAKGYKAPGSIKLFK